MELANKKALPLTMLKEIRTLHAEARKMASEYDRIVSDTEGEEYIFQIYLH